MPNKAYARSDDYVKWGIHYGTGDQPHEAGDKLRGGQRSLGVLANPGVHGDSGRDAGVDGPG
jgi:hypothetical protein